jgi:predicted nucleic acid-binding protein
MDTDVIICILRGRDDIKEKMKGFIQDIEEKLFITPIQISEVFAGLKEKEKIDAALFFEALPCVLINDQTGRLAGEYLNKYKKSHGVTLAEAMIAACSRIYGLKLWTLNKKHYPMISRNCFVE